MKFIVTFMIEVAIKPRRDGINGLEFTRYGVVPFVPQPGMMLNAGRDDYRKVESVYWDHAEPNRLTVWFEFDPRNKADDLRQAGWKEGM